MDPIASCVSARYKLAIDLERLSYAWSTFVDWTFLKGLARDLESLADAFKSQALHKKAQFVGHLDQRLTDMDRYSSRFRALRQDPSGLAELKSEVSPLMNFWVNVSDKIPDEDQILDILDRSPVLKELNSFNRDALINRIMSLSEIPRPNELQWLKSLDFGRPKAALAHVRRYIPDFGVPASEAGSFEFFEAWIRGLPTGWADWEDVLPNEFEATTLESTSLWERVAKLLGGKERSAFAYLEDSAIEVVDNLEDVG